MKGIKRHYKSIAKQFDYGADILQMIDEAKTEAEIIRIMTSARRGEYERRKKV